MKDGWISCSDGEEKRIIEIAWDDEIERHLEGPARYYCLAEDLYTKEYSLWNSVSWESMNLRCCLSASMKGRYFSFKGRRES